MNNLPFYSELELQVLCFLTVKSSDSQTVDMLSVLIILKASFMKTESHTLSLKSQLAQKKMVFIHTFAWSVRSNNQFDAFLTQHDTPSFCVMFTPSLTFRTYRAFCKHASHVHHLFQKVVTNYMISKETQLCSSDWRIILVFCRWFACFHDLAALQRPSTLSCMCISGPPQESWRNVCRGTVTLNK